MDTPAKKVHEDYGHTHLKMMHRQDAFSRNKITKVSEKTHGQSQLKNSRLIIILAVSSFQ